jgi:hypothetical protein
VLTDRFVCPAGTPGQVTERFTKALERLDSEELYVRIALLDRP